MPTFDGVTGRVYYKAWRVPPPRSAAVVFLHGFGEHSGLYHRLGNALNGAGIELWVLDEIGHGLTEGDRAVIESIGDLVENGRRLTAIAEAAQPGIPVWLAGHSLGAAAAAVSAARDPGRYAGLVLSGAALSPLDWVLALGDADAPDLDLDPAGLSSDPFYLDELEHDPLAFTSAAGARSLATVLPAAWDELAGDFGQVALPVLLVHGSDDPVVPVAQAREWAARLKRARLAEFPGARHDILNETVHRDVAAAITEFVLTAGGPGGTATRTETNREIIRQAFDAWRQGTGAITGVFAPDMVWRIEGHSAASKEYLSKQQFIDEVLVPFGARFTESEPFRPVTIRAVYADGDTVIVIWDGRGIASDGQPYENSYAWIMKLADGKVIDGTAFFDSISFNDLWARVQPR